MPSLVRRLARRHVPLPVRQRLVAIKRAATQPPARPRTSPAAKKAARKAAKQAAEQAAAPAKTVPTDVLVEALRSGRPLVDAIVTEVRALLAAGKLHDAVSLSASLRKEPETSTVGALAGAVAAFAGGYVHKSWTAFAEVPAQLRWTHAPAEYVRAGVACDRDGMLDEVRDLAQRQPVWIDAEGWLDMLGVVFGAGDEALSRTIFALFDAAVDESVHDAAGNGEPLAVERDWLRPWVAASDNSPGAEIEPGRVSIGIMAYGHPGRRRASANIGDHVQSVASLGHLVRHQDLTFHGPSDLVDLLAQLRGRVRPEIARTGLHADVEVRTVDRDASTYDTIPPNTWTLSFGWYMHAIFEQRYGLPFHANLLPMFVSFHCSKRDLLTPQTLDYLRRFGPIGCRDWTTVDLLLSLDVPAFFSGCMTTTTSNVFPELVDEPAADSPVAYVDMPADSVPADAKVFLHSNDAVRFRSFTTNVYDAVDLLETYRRNHSAVVTSRLHCWLPVRSLGMAVDFQPTNRSDVRFAGLIDTTQAEFDAIRDGVNDKLEQVMSAILAGGSPDDVYGLWRRITATEVETARRRRADPGPALTRRADLDDDIASVIDRTTIVGRENDAADAIDVAVLVPNRAVAPLEVLLESLIGNTARTVRVWLVTRDAAQLDLDALSRRFASAQLAIVPTEDLGPRVTRGDGRPLPPRDLDLLALGAILPDVERVVVLPVDALVTGDIAQLAGLDLGGRLLAAPTVVGRRGASGFGIIHVAAMRLGAKTVAAADLRHRAYARHAFDFDAFNTGVLVLDLDRMRTSDLLNEYLPYVEEFGLAARETLHLVVGPNRAVVPERWDNVPTRSDLDEPGLLHWADPIKPWSRDYVARQEAWRAVRDELDVTGADDGSPLSS